MSYAVAKVLSRHRKDLARLEFRAMRKQAAYAKGVNQAFDTGGATEIPGASDRVLGPVRDWRKEVRDTYADIKDVEEGRRARKLGLTTYAQLDNGIYHLIKALKAGPNAADEIAKARRYFTAAQANSAKLDRKLF